MSHQTKEQSIGYILKALLNSKLPADEILDVVRLSKIFVEERTDITNEDTVKFWNLIAGKLQLDEALIQEIRSEIYYLFDVKTVEESEEYFAAFSVLYPMLSN